MKTRWITINSILLLLAQITYSQTSTLEIRIKNQPDYPVVIGTLRGEKFSPLDTLELRRMNKNSTRKGVSWQFPVNASIGMYRAIFGQTTYARVMDEPPQQLDFIFNHENIILETDFKAPLDSLKIVQSEENLLWFNFLKKEQKFSDQLELLEKEVDYFQAKLTEIKNAPDAKSSLREVETQMARKANSFNQLQLERDSFIEKLVQENENYFSTGLIKLFQEPFQDGFLSRQERREYYQDEYFRYFDFSDESLIHATVLTDKIFDYLVTFNQPGLSNEQREMAYLKGVNKIMREIEQDNDEAANPVFDFVLDYLVTGFERLNMEGILIHLAENYSAKLCQSDEKTTLQRKLEAQKMKTGTVVPDFTLNDLNGDPVTLMHVLKPKNLIVFWASWCPHCTEMLPQIKGWYNRVENNELEIITVSLDTDKAKWQQAVFDAGFEAFYNLSDLQEWDGDVAEKYNIYATPTMFIIDDNLRILAKPISVNEMIEYFGK
jgi:peroxiredoxin